MTVAEIGARLNMRRKPLIIQIGVVHIHPSATLLPALIYFLSAGYFVLLTAIAVAVHELGHYAALRLSGGEIKRLKLWIGGVSMVYGGLGYAGEAITALAGPLASLLLAVAASFFGRIFSGAAISESAYHLAGLSLLLAIFNMLPVFPLDGGRVLFATIARLAGLEPAECVRKICAVLLTAAIGAAGTLMLWVSGNPTLFIAAVFLALGASGHGE